MDEWVNALGAQEEQDRSPVGEHTYLCIDLKTFYASVECADRGLDPFTSRLVVADPSRGRSTICLAITPALKELGIRNRCRVFEIPEQILATTIMARPRMRHYMEVSAQIYGTYLEFVSPSDIHPYSIDECFIDATPTSSAMASAPRHLHGASWTPSRSVTISAPPRASAPTSFSPRWRST